MLEKIKKYKDLYQFITIIITILGAVWAFFQWNEQNVEIHKKVQQMSLKSIVWNDNVPLVERMNACDDYINLGYNSYTKAYCEELLEK